jgi:thiol-disulfide isomerase/thioredoxin
MSNHKPSADKRPPLATYFWAGLASILIGFAAVYVSRGPDDNAKSEAEAGRPAAGQPTPDPSKPLGGMVAFVKKSPPEPLPEVSFTGKDGAPLTLAAFKGKAILLNLWATWCAPCRKEMPSLDRLQKELGSNKFEVVALAVDRTGLDGARKFLEETKIESLKLYADQTARSGTALKAVGMPTTILIDAEGRELGRLAGPAEWDSPEAKKLIEAALR